MKNLLNCHVVGMHSFPITENKNFYERIFTTTSDHVLHNRKNFELAIHPHHVNIKITVLRGTLTNVIYRLSDNGDIVLKEFVFNSVIQNGIGGFKHIGEKRLEKISEITYKEGENFSMESCDMHTVYVPKFKESAWIVQEDIPTCEYFPVSYSDMDLEKWEQDNLYIEVSNGVRDIFLKNLQYQHLLKNEQK